MYYKSDNSNHGHMNVTFGMSEILVLCGVALLLSSLTGVGYTLLILGIVSSIGAFGQRIKQQEEHNKLEQDRFESIRNAILSSTVTQPESNVVNIDKSKDDSTDYH